MPKLEMFWARTSRVWGNNACSKFLVLGNNVCSKSLVLGNNVCSKSKLWCWGVRRPWNSRCAVHAERIRRWTCVWHHIRRRTWWLDWGTRCRIRGKTWRSLATTAVSPTLALLHVVPHRWRLQLAWVRRWMAGTGASQMGQMIQMGRRDQMGRQNFYPANSFGSSIATCSPDSHWTLHACSDMGWEVNG